VEPTLLAKETIGLAKKAIPAIAKINSPATLVTTDALTLPKEIVFMIEISFSLNSGLRKS
jgi:hypothetical protein